ncbi:MAG: hypothetical protein Q8S21_02735 [Candidatus Paracaedibacteraceae bacterium]|nr:hypothetical protein [Candidatus Paracaedibacteraceae bacterium]
MKHDQVVISKVPRPSRLFQIGIIKDIDSRFQELVEVPCANERCIKKMISKSKLLLLDIRYILLYQSFDYDIREKIIVRTDSILQYINTCLDATNKSLV